MEREKQTAKDLALAPGNFSAFVENHILRTADPQARQLLEAAIGVAKSNQTQDLERFVAALQPARLASNVLVHSSSVLAATESIQALVDSAATFDSVEAFLRSINERELRLGAMRSKDCIRLSTIESAKGLEFDHVMIPSLNAGEFDGISNDDRNLFYVAITRAKNLLTVMYDQRSPSQYLREAGLLHSL